LLNLKGLSTFDLIFVGFLKKVLKFYSINTALSTIILARMIVVLQILSLPALKQGAGNPQN